MYLAYLSKRKKGRKNRRKDVKKKGRRKCSSEY
jgi:hypothetical protein